MDFQQALDPIRSLKAAWQLLKQAPLTVIVGGLLLGFLEGGNSGGLRFLVSDHGPRGLRFSGWSLEPAFDELRPVLLLLVPGVVCVALALFALSSWIEVGFARAVESALRSGRDEVGKVFSGGDRFGAMLLARFLSGLIQLASGLPIAAAVLGVVLLSGHGGPRPLVILGLIGFVLLWLVLVFYVALGLFLVNPIVAFESCTPTEALARSWQLASGNRLQLFWFVLLQGLLVIASVVCTCCLGLLLTMPLTQTMRFEAYVALTKGEQYPQWWIGSGRFPFDEHKPEDYGSPPAPPPVPPPLPPQS
jgi:hypothetical protein